MTDLNMDQAFQIVLNTASSQLSDRTPICAKAVEMVAAYHLLFIKPETERDIEYG